MSETATVAPILRRGKPIRRGRWAYVSHQYNGPVWRLDGTTLDLEHDPASHAVCIGGNRCNGGWILYRDGRYAEPVAEYLAAAMEVVEEQYAPSDSQALDRIAALLPSALLTPEVLEIARIVQSTGREVYGSEGAQS